MMDQKSQYEQLVSKPTEGEEFLMDFFRSERIAFKYQALIPDLKDDRRSFRVADFYLPQYKVYVEFLGMWNVSDLKKEDYREKKRVYVQNEIPCIYLYPENLGIIHYSFNKRLREVLKKYGLKNELFRFNLKLFWEADKSSFIGLVILIGLLVSFQFDRAAKNYWQWSGVVSCGIIWMSYNLIIGYMKFFKKGYSYVAFAKE